MAVGDDAQCIYTWRGANVENILTFPDRHPGTVIHRIETNYRSTPQILALANGVLLAQPKGRGFEKELKAHRANSEKPYYVQSMDGREQAQFIVQRIRGLVDEGCSLADIGILYRAHFQALDIQLELSRLQMPYPDHQRRPLLRAGPHPRSRRPPALRPTIPPTPPRGTASPSSSPRSATKTRRNSTPPPSTTRACSSSISSTPSTATT